MTTAVRKLIFCYIFSSYKHTDERSCFAKNPDHLVSRIINSRNVEPRSEIPGFIEATTFPITIIKNPERLEKAFV
jgi:hypothetical protein